MAKATRARRAAGGEPIVDGLLATLAPLERRRSLPNREQRQEIRFLRRELEIRTGEIQRQ